MMQDPLVAGFLGGLLAACSSPCWPWWSGSSPPWHARPSAPTWLERFAWPVALGCWTVVAVVQFLLITDRVALAAAMVPPVVVAGLMAPDLVGLPALVAARRSARVWWAASRAAERVCAPLDVDGCGREF